MFSPFSREGRGVHTGRIATVQVEVGPPGSGVVFVCQMGEIPASPDTLSASGERATSLEFEGRIVRTVEHLLSALVMAGERDVRLTLEGGDEVPILDGGAERWMQALLDHGAKENVAFVEIGEEVRVRRGDSYARLTPVREQRPPTYAVYLDFEEYGLGTQHICFRPGADSFFSDIAPARTFALLEEIEELWSRGLARGGDLESALVIGKQGVVNPGGERFENEPARHKMLDAIGDLSLLGGLPFADLHLEKPGHHLLHELVVKASTCCRPSKGEDR